jgi:hypothetical protein
LHLVVSERAVINSQRSLIEDGAAMSIAANNAGNGRDTLDGAVVEG